jgi:hypothetical protein
MVIKVKDLVAHGRHDFVKQLSNHGGNDMRVPRQRGLNVSGHNRFFAFLNVHDDRTSLSMILPSLLVLFTNGTFSNLISKQVAEVALQLRAHSHPPLPIKSSLDQSKRARMRSLFSSGWTVEATCDLREVHGATAAVAILTRPTLGAPRRAIFPGGDGETPCLKVRSDEVRNGPSWRSQAAAAPCGFTSR